MTERCGSSVPNPNSPTGEDDFECRERVTCECGKCKGHCVCEFVGSGGGQSPAYRGNRSGESGAVILYSAVPLPDSESGVDA